VRLAAILAGIAFVVAVALIARAMDQHDASEARKWNDDDAQ
jgi:hypothetical protein